MVLLLAKRPGVLGGRILSTKTGTCLKICYRHNLERGLDSWKQATEHFDSLVTSQGCGRGNDKDHSSEALVER